MVFSGTCTRYLCIQNYLTGSDMCLQSHLGLCKAVVHQGFQGRTKELPLGQRNGPKAFGLPQGLTGTDSGKSK